MKTFSWFKHPAHWSESRKWVSASLYTRLPIEKVLTLAVTLYEYANEQHPRGTVTGFDPSLYDHVFRWKKGTALRIVEQFRAQGIILDDDRLEDWPEETQEEGLSDKKTSTSRVREYRERKRKNETPDETPVKRDETHIRYKNKNLEKEKYTPLTPQGVGGCEASQQEDQHTHMPETPERRTVNTGLPSRGGANASWWKEFTSLWDIWPNRQGKDAAWCVYCDFRRRKLDMPPLYVLRDKASAMIAQDRKFLAGYVPELKTWLREHRWNDEPCPPRDVAVPGRGRTSREQQMATDVERAAEAARRFEDFFEMAADEPAAEGVFA